MADRTSLVFCDQHKIFTLRLRQECRLKGNGLGSDRHIPFALWIPTSPFSTLQPADLPEQQQAPLPFGFWSVFPQGAPAGKRWEKRGWDRTIYLPGSIPMWLPRASLSLHQRSLTLSRSVWLHCPLLSALPLPALITLGHLAITALLLLDSGYFPRPCGLPSPNLKASSPSCWDPDLYRLFIYILLLPTFLQDYQSNEPKWLLPPFFLFGTWSKESFPPV